MTTKKRKGKFGPEVKLIISNKNLFLFLIIKNL